MQFPDNFLWGVALSSYQTEGDNKNSDWWLWEEENQKQPSGAACRHYELFEEDFSLAQSLGFSTLRLSFEWSRIEPEEGKFDFSEIKHYHNVIQALRNRKLKPVVTLHHFTNPIWFSRRGGWLDKKAPFYFSRYVKMIVSEFARDVHLWVTFNEPYVYLYNSYISGVWPPQEKSLFLAKKIDNNIVRAHLSAYRIIKEIYREKKLVGPQVSIAKNIRGFIATDRNPYYRIKAKTKDYLFNFMLLERLIRLKALDFIGLNYYTCEFLPKPSLALPKSSLGWFIYPKGLLDLLCRFSQYNLPIFILENGIATNNDTQREEFVVSHIEAVAQAIKAGTNIIGYLYWSLIDNFEWDKGFRPRFGLIEVDYKTYERKIRPSARTYSKICQSNQI